MTIAVDDVATDAHLSDEVGAEELANIIPDAWSGSAAKARQSALNDVLKDLRRRVPPIAEGDLADVTELKDAVVYGALERLYATSITTAGDVHAIQQKRYLTKFAAEVRGLQPTLTGKLSGPGATIGIERR